MRKDGATRIGLRAVAPVVLVALLIGTAVPRVGLSAAGSGGATTAVAPASVPTPQITLTSSSGPPSTDLTVTGTGFPASSTVNLSLVDPGCPSFNITGSPYPYNLGLSGIAVNLSGGFSVSDLFVPYINAGTYDVIATDGPIDVSTPYTVVPLPSGSHIDYFITPTSAAPGDPVQLSGTGFYPGDTENLYLGNLTGFSRVQGFDDNFSTGAINYTWTVPAVSPGSYQLFVVGSTYGSGFASLTILGASVAPVLSLNLSGGPVGSPVLATGSGYAATSPITFTFDTVPTAFVSCTGGALNLTTGNVTTNSSGGFDCAFDVPPATAGPKLVKAVDSQSDSQSTTFNVTVPEIALSSYRGPVGITVDVSGSGFYQADTSLAIASTPSGAVGSPFACSATLGALTDCFFTVASGTPVTEPGASFTVSVSGVGGPEDNATSAAFTVSTPTISLSAHTGPDGTRVTITGSGFSTSDGSMAISSVPGGAIGGPTSCTASAGTLRNCYFTVATGVPETDPGASFVVVVTGQAGASDSATSSPFTVARPSITLSMYTGRAGFQVHIRGSDFSSSDTTMKVSSSPAGAVGPPIVCSAKGGVLATCYFTVAVDVKATEPGASFTVTVAGIRGSADLATSSPFTVSKPSIALSAYRGVDGQTVEVAGSGFYPLDHSVTVASIPAGAVASRSCPIGAGGVLPSCPVEVTRFSSLTEPGLSFQITGTGTGGSGDKGASAPFMIAVPELELTPSAGQPGATLTVTGTGFAAASSVRVVFGSLDSGCLGGTTPTGTFRCVFQVPLTAPGPVPVTASVVAHTSYAASAPFRVEPLPTGPLPAYLLNVTSPNVEGPDKIAGYEGFLLNAWSLTLSRSTSATGLGSGVRSTFEVDAELNFSESATPLASVNGAHFNIEIIELGAGTDAGSPYAPTIISLGDLNFSTCRVVAFSLSGATGVNETLQVSFACENVNHGVSVPPPVSLPTTYPYYLLNVSTSTTPTGTSASGGTAKYALLDSWSLAASRFHAEVTVSLWNFYLKLITDGIAIKKVTLVERFNSTAGGPILTLNNGAVSNLVESASSGEYPTVSMEVAYATVGISGVVS